MSIQMYIPAVGDEIILDEDWTFDLYDEDRNDTLFEVLKIDRHEILTWHQKQVLPYSATIPAGTTLKIDRIYIKKGLPEYNSVTFFWKGASTESKTITGWQGHVINVPKRACRFWAKLDDVNTIKFHTLAE